VKALFFYVYSIFSFLSYFVALPFVLALSFKTKYRRSLPARFLLWRNPPLKADGIWFHVCSYGEARAIAPLIASVPQTQRRVTTTTQTGMSVAQTYTSQSRYLPFEPLLFFWMRPQKMLVVFEAELWYLLFTLAKRRGMRTVLINARISERSFPRYRRFAWLYRRIFAHIDAVYAQSEEDKRRLESLGAHNVCVAGNMKLAALPKPTKTYDKPSNVTVCAASTHEGEEALILEAFAALKRHRPDAMLLMVPRHPERFERVAAMCRDAAQKEGWRTVRFSASGIVSDADIVCVDAMGELVNLYAISDVVVMGGSFVPVGGHNLAEAAQFGCRIMTGPHLFNQHEMLQALEGITIVERSELSETLVTYYALPHASIKRKAKTDMLKKELAI